MRIVATRRALAFVLSLALSPLASAQQATHSASWWDPADSGWGVATLDQGNVVGPYWFTYDENGKPTWFMGLTLPQADGSFAGDLYRFTGTPFPLITGHQAYQPGNIVGQVRLSFDADPKRMSFAYTIGGQTITRALQRFNFDGKDVVCEATSAPRTQAENYTDMWWEPASSGWGINLMHLGENIYGQWYTYESPDRAVFMTLGLVRQADGRFTGKVYRQKDGGRPYKSAAAVSSQPGGEEIGTAALHFIDGTRAEFDFTVDGKSSHHQVQRFQVGSVANLCKVQPYDAGSGGGDGDGTAGTLCHPPYQIGDMRRLRSTGSSNGTASAPSEHVEEITGTATFNGQSGLVQKISGQTSAGNGVYANDYVGNGDGTILSFGAEAVDPATGQVISTSRNDPARVEMSRRFTVGETVALDYAVNSTSAAGSGRHEMKTTYRLLGVETVSVPAGSFQACKFEVTIEEASTVAGVSTRTLLSGLNWTDPTFGRVKQQFEGTSTVSAYGFNTTTPLSSAEELLEATMNGQHTP